MPTLLNWKQVKAQSDSVFNQFGEKVWIPNAKKNVNLKRKDTRDFHNIGIGKHLLCCALGESLEHNVDAIKKYRDRVDILTCDKGFRPLLERGIKADYVILCDANILFDKWMGDAIKETKGVKLIATPYANPEWTTKWQGDRYFFINKDALESEKIFLNIFGKNTRVVPAGSNVSNAMLIFFTGADEVSNVNYSGYERFLLVGYDYSWRPDSNYYAWKNPIPKRYYMSHRTLLDMNNDVVFTSENLLFSAKWLYSYITVFHLPAVNCSQRGLLEIPLKGNLNEELERINTNKIQDCQIYFKIMKDAYRKFQITKAEFEKARKELIRK
jgi:hypothetical protein